MAVLIAVALGFGWWRAKGPVERPLMRFSADLGPEAVENPGITAVISPDGARLAFAVRGSGGKTQLAMRLLDQAQATLLAGTENAVHPFFSPDGQWIGFFADGKMKKISVQGGAAVTLCEAPSDRGASWGEDGSIIAALNAFSGLSRVPAAGGTPQAITKPGDKGEVSHRWPQILPGGQAVLFTGNARNVTYDNASIEVLSLKTGQWKAVQRGGYFGRYSPTGHLVYVHRSTLFVVGFDLDRLEVRGMPAPLLEDVAGNTTTGGGQYDVARNGTFVYLSGKSAGIWPLVWLDSTGKTEPLLATPETYFNPRFSPDGKRLLFEVSGKGIFVYDWEQDRTTKLTFNDPRGAGFGVLTPDGRHIVFETNSPATLQWIRSDGAGEAHPLLESKTNLRAYSFSPDGKRLAFAQAAPQTGFDLWTLPLDLTDPEHPRAGKPELFLSTPADPPRTCVPAGMNFTSKTACFQPSIALNSSFSAC